MSGRAAVIAVCFLLCAGAVWAETQEELKAFVDKAVTHCNDAGKEQCLKDFTENPDGLWVKEELYVFAFDYEGVCIAHGANKNLIGQNLTKLKDVKGKKFILAMLEAAQKGEGWVDYYWNHPQTKKVKPKIVHVKKVDETFWIAAGIYK